MVASVRESNCLLVGWDGAEARPPRRRTFTHRCPKFIRRVKGSKYQLRIYLGGDPGNSINLGLYETVEAAIAVRKEFNLRNRAPTDTPWLPPGILPRWVYRRPDGRFGCRVRKRYTWGKPLRGWVVWGAFDDMWAAHRVAKAWASTWPAEVAKGGRGRAGQSLPAAPLFN